MSTATIVQLSLFLASVGSDQHWHLISLLTFALHDWSHHEGTFLQDILWGNGKLELERSDEGEDNCLKP